MDPSLDDSLTLEGMDFDHSVDVVNQEDIPLEDSGRLDSISMDMDGMGERSQALLQNVNDEVIVSDLIEEPFAFQEYNVQTGASGSNIMVDPNQLSQLSLQQDAVSNTQTLLKGSATGPTNVVTLKVAQPRTQKRQIASAPPRQVAIAPKPTKTVQYAIAPKPVALVTNKQNAGSMKKVPISSDGKGNTVLAQIGRQLVMVPKKIKLMSSTSTEGVISSSSGGLQYQVSCTPEQAQNMTNKGTKPLIKFIQVPDRSSIEQATNSGLLTKVVPTNAPRARYVMQQKTVPISIGGNKFDLQNVKIAGKRQIIAIKSQSKLVQVPQGNVATKKVVISSNSSQKMAVRTTAPTSTSQVTKDTISSGQRTQFHPINVPGKGIQYIKLVTNQPKSAQKPMAFPAKNFVLTDSKGNVIQMTAEKVGGQSQSVVIPTSVTAGKVVKGAKKLVRIAPVMKTVTQPVSQASRSSQSLLAPITTVTPTTTVPMKSLPLIESPGVSSKETVPIQEIDDIDQQSEKMDHSYTDEKSIRHSFNLSYIDKSKTDSNDFSIEDDYSAATEYAEEDSSHLPEETVQEVIAEETVDVKPTLQSLITEAVSDNKGGDGEIECLQDVEVEFEKKYDCIRNASFVLRDDNVDHNTSASDMNEETIIIVPGTNYMDKQNESMYSDDSRLYHSRRHSTEERRDVPLMSVEAECLPYPEITIPLSPGLSSDQDASANLDMRPRKACNCTKSQCLKLYCDCFANGEFCNGCNCNNCHNNLENEEVRQKAIRSCLERNPNAFRPKIGKAKAGGPEIVRRHTKGCNCKRSGCLKNYCECYEAKIACTAMCKCVGCRNVEEILVRRRDTVRMRVREKLNDSTLRPATAPVGPVKQPCSFMTTEVIEAVCQCLIAAAGESDTQRGELDPVQDVIEEFARCLQDVITASHHTL